MTNEEQTYRVTLDGTTLVSGLTYTEAFAWLLRRQGQSVSYATTYAGYAIEDDQPSGGES